MAADRSADTAVEECAAKRSPELSLRQILASPAALPERALALDHVTSLDLSRNGLAELPEGIFGMEQLVSLDISANSLAGDGLHSAIGQLTNLRYLNAMNNRLTHVPDSLCTLGSLYRLGLKSNALEALPEGFGGLKGLVELFLTDNRLTTFPESIGECTALVKLQASRNRLRTLPESLGRLPNLEMLRVAVNELQALPRSLSAAPRLAWASLASNALSPPAPPPTHTIPTVAAADLAVGGVLGEGASGEVVRVQWRGKPYALKRFCFDDASPDGRAGDEVDVKLFVEHPYLTRVVARVEDGGVGLVMEVVDGAPIAEKPNLQSLLRCRWKDGLTLGATWARNAARTAASALDYLHSNGIAHGDVYAHNMLAAPDGRVVLCDYGAAFFYPHEQRAVWEAVEVLAFGLFLADVAAHVEGDSAAPFEELAEACKHPTHAERPRFAQIVARVDAMEQHEG